MRLQISHNTAFAFRARRGGEPSVSAGIATPVELSLGRIRRYLRLVPGAGMVTAHVPWSAAFAGVLDTLGIASIVMVRGLRDVAVSSAQHIARRPAHPLHDHFARLPTHNRIMKSLEGVTDRTGATNWRTSGSVSSAS